MGLTIWCNAKFNESAERLLAEVLPVEERD